MWHESRSEEKKMAGLMADRKKRAERRKEHYEKTLGDPNQCLQVHGRGLTVSLEPSVALAADAPANMMPWAGDPKVIIDRFDGRAALDSIPEYVGGGDNDVQSESREEKNERRSVNYERYRILVQNEYLGVTEEKFLKTLELEEKFGENTYQSATAKEKAKEEKKKSVNKAAIGFVYNDSTGGVPISKRDEEPDDDDEDEEEEEEEEDFDLTVDVMNLGPDHQEEINKIGKEYDLGSRHFFRFLVKEEEEKEEQRIARDAYAKKPPAKDEMGRKKRRSRTNVRVLTKSEMRRPAYAQRTGSESPGSRTASESSESDSEPGEEKVEFITSFGGEEELEAIKRREEEADEKRRMKKAHYEKPIGPSLQDERRKRSRGRSKSRSRGHSRSRSKGRGRHSSSDSRQDQVKKQRVESSAEVEAEKVSSSDSSSEEEGGGGGYRSKYRNRRADSSSDSSDEENRREETRRRKRDSPPRAPPPPAISVPKVEAPPPVKRYYGRRKEDSDSELSGLEDEKADIGGGARAQLRPDQGNANGGNGKMWSSRAKEETKALTIKEKLKRKMQQQLKKTFKEDKKAEKERLKKMEEEEKMRDEELKEMSDKMRERVRERRRAEGDVGVSSDEDGSPLSGLWRQDRDRERRRSRSRERKRRSREHSGEKKEERRGHRREEEGRRGRRRSRSRSKGKQGEDRLSGAALRLVDY